MLGLRRYDGVSEDAQSVHPMGKPMSASTKRGFKTRPPVEVGSPPVAIVSCRGERHVASVRVVPACLPLAVE